MGRLESTIKSEIMRLAKRQVKTAFIPLRREVRKMSFRLSGLSRGIASLNRMAKELRLEEGKPKLEATPEEVKASRLSPQRIRGLRRKLGLSQRELGILTGTSLGAILSWEKGKFKPRGDKKTALVALRKLGKREVKNLLSQKAGESKKSKPERKPLRKRRSRKVAPRKEKRVTRQRKPVARKSKKMK